MSLFRSCDLCNNGTSHQFIFKQVLESFFDYIHVGVPIIYDGVPIAYDGVPIAYDGVPITSLAFTLA